MSNTESSNYQKHTRSKGLRKKLIDNFNYQFLSYFVDIYKSNINSVLDVGCGEGFMLKLIHDQYESLELSGCDISETALDYARVIVPSASFFRNDANYIEAHDKTFDVAVCTEVLEHVEEPKKILSEIQRVGRKFVILTVPHEPFYCLSNLFSGRYLKSFGNHPEHIQHFSMKTFKKTCNQFFNEIKCASIFPWIIYVGSIINEEGENDA